MCGLLKLYKNFRKSDINYHCLSLGRTKGKLVASISWKLYELYTMKYLEQLLALFPNSCQSRYSQI